MKYYYLGFNRVYLNPWTEQVLNCFDAIVDFVRCGPGFHSSIDQLRCNLSDNDVLIVDSLILEHKKFLKIKRPFGSSYYGGNFLEFEEQLTSMVEIFDNHKGKRIFLGNLDVYAASKHLVQYIKDNNILVVSFSDLNTTLDYTQTDLSHAVIHYANPTSNWLSLVTSRPELIISFPHFIDANEFVCAKLDEKKYFFDIPGVMYENRRAVERLLKRNDRLRLYRYKLKRMIDFLPNKLNGKFTFKRVKTLNLSFRLRIFDTKIVYTCGSLFDFPVRKFFEIPSQSSLLVCKPFYGMFHLGFEKDVTHIESCGLEAIINSGLGEEAQQIAYRGFDLVRSKHSSTAREKQLKQCIEKLERGVFFGSCWNNGKYEV